MSNNESKNGVDYFCESCNRFWIQHNHIIDYWHPVLQQSIDQTEHKECDICKAQKEDK